MGPLGVGEVWQDARGRGRECGNGGGGVSVYVPRRAQRLALSNTNPLGAKSSLAYACTLDRDGGRQWEGRGGVGGGADIIA